jgi:alpha-galactosidase/6-phospho-beta-glucosidase family protein
MTKIVLIGAGSAQFGTDMLCELFAAREKLKGSAILMLSK